MNRVFITILIVCITYISCISQQVAKAEKGTYLLQNGTIHTVTDGVFIGDVLLKDNKIFKLGSRLEPTENAIIINCTGLHVFPGFIDAGSRLGLVEIDAVSVTNDFREHGNFVPNMKAITAINPNSVSIPVTRVDGITTVFSKPEGGLFPGSGALIDLFGYTPSQMYAGSEGIILNFPSTGRRGRWDRRTEEEIKKDVANALTNLKNIWEDALLYSKMDSTAIASSLPWTRNNPQLDAMLPVVRGKSPLFVEVNSAEDILECIKWLKNYKIDAVLMGVAEGWKVANKIKEANYPVITGPVIALPNRSHDKYDAAYANAGKLSKAGIKVALRTNNAENTRNLPFHAGFAVAYGMDKEEALKSVTLYPAEIFGVDKNYGSITEGKIANIFIADGDPFEPKTKIKYLFIRGWNVPLESRHTLLFDEFINRSPGN